MCQGYMDLRNGAKYNWLSLDIAKKVNQKMSTIALVYLDVEVNKKYPNGKMKNMVGGSPNQ
jgi:hypothetical protein